MARECNLGSPRAVCFHDPNAVDHFCGRGRRRSGRVLSVSNPDAFRVLPFSDGILFSPAAVSLLPLSRYPGDAGPVSNFATRPIIFFCRKVGGWLEGYYLYSYIGTKELLQGLLMVPGTLVWTSIRCSAARLPPPFMSSTSTTSFASQEPESAPHLRGCERYIRGVLYIIG